jgi:hypothetical protein
MNEPGIVMEMSALMGEKIRILRQQIMYDWFDLATLSLQDERRRQVLKNEMADACKQAERAASRKLETLGWNLKNFLPVVEEYFGEEPKDPNEPSAMASMNKILQIAFAEYPKLLNDIKTKAGLSCKKQLDKLRKEINKDVVA